MRIVLDGRSIVNGGTSPGAIRVAKQLAVHLPQVDSSIEVSFFFNSFRPRFLPIARAACPAGVTPRICRIPSRIVTPLLESGAAPIELFAGPLDVFHSLFWNRPPRAWRGRVVVSVYDAMVLRHPEFLHPDWVSRIRRSLEIAIRRADTILVPTRFTYTELLNTTEVTPARVRIIPIGVGEAFLKPVEPERVKRVRVKYGLPETYVLSVATLEPKKNIPRLVRAFLAVREALGPEVGLVLAGTPGWNWRQIAQEMEALGPKGWVRQLDFVEDDDLPALMAGAQCLALVSLYEGFGIPALEAMALGIPVVASQGTGVGEVAGEAALLVDPQNVEQIGQALVAAVRNAEIRGRLSAAGRARASRYSWERIAREMVKMYAGSRD